MLVALVAFVVVDSLTTKHVQAWLEDFVDWNRTSGALGPFLFAVVYVIATVCVVPGSLLTLGAGFAFSQAFGQGHGVVVASVTTFCGATAGSVLAFLNARYILRGTVTHWAHQFRVLRAIDRAIETEAFKTVALLRLSPAIPFVAFNYVMGITSCPLVPYALASVGMIPGTIAYCYFGSLLSDAKDAAQGRGTDTNPAIRWSILGAGILATVLALFIVTRYARRHLQDLLREEEHEEHEEQPAANDEVVVGDDGEGTSNDSIGRPRPPPPSNAAFPDSSRAQAERAHPPMLLGDPTGSHVGDADGAEGGRMVSRAARPFSVEQPHS